MKKDFRQNVQQYRQEKNEQVTFNENKRLREDINDYKKEIENLREVIKKSNKESFILIDEIKLIDNIRSEIDQQSIEELKASIQTNGQLQAVLLTQDNYLIAGYRRYTAFKELGKEKILVNYYDKKYDEIKDEIKFLQFEENEKRQSIDNFDIATLFNNCLKEGYTQQEVAEIFGKSKGFVSSVIKLNNMDSELIKYIREFQTFAYSYQKFIAMNLDDVQENKFYQKNRGVIGWLTLYTIAKHDKVEDQKTAFLKKFKNRLSEEELRGYYFIDEYKNMLIDKENNKYTKAFKSIDSLKKSIEELAAQTENHNIMQVTDYILSAEKLLIDIFGKEIEEN